MPQQWVNYCRECDQPTDEVTGAAPSEHCEPCGHDKGFYGKLIDVASEDG